MTLHIFTGSTDARHGSDDFRMREAFGELRARLDTDGMLELNTIELAPRGLTPDVLLQHASTPPFLAEARLVIVEGLLTQLGGARGVAADWQPFVDAVPGLPEATHLVLLEPAAAREQRATLGRSPLLRSLRGIDGVEVRSFAELRLSGRDSSNEVAAWLRQRAQARRYELESEAAERLSQLLGADLWAQSTELEKLSQYASGRAITVADVEALTSQAREEDVFAIVDDVVEGRPGPALLRLRRMLESGSEHPARIQGLIARQVRNLVRAAELLEAGAERDEIGSATGVTHPYPLRKLTAQAQAIGREGAERQLRAIEAADHAVKSGRYSDALALDLLVTTLAANRPTAADGRRRSTRVPAGARR